MKYSLSIAFAGSLILGILGCQEKSDADQLADSIESTVENALEGAGEALESAGEAVGEAAENAAEAFGEGVEKAGEALESAGEEAAVEARAMAKAKLNLNTASEEDFGTIPGMNRRMIREFNEYRPYVSIRQFRKEMGKYVDEETIAGYEKYVFVPVDVNQCDEATLQQIPGVNAARAKALTEARPFDSNESFLKILADRIPSANLELEIASARHLLK